MTGLLRQYTDLDFGICLAQGLSQAITGITTADDDDWLAWRRSNRRCRHRERRRTDRHADGRHRLRVFTDIEHLEICLADVAFGADPILGNILPARAGENAILGPAQSLVVNQTANDA
ncbi:hypothetical protein D3C84_687270 [compost metagenome]